MERVLVHREDLNKLKEAIKDAKIMMDIIQSYTE